MFVVSGDVVVWSIMTILVVCMGDVYVGSDDYVCYLSWVIFACAMLAYVLCCLLVIVGLVTCVLGVLLLSLLRRAWFWLLGIFSGIVFFLVVSGLVWYWVGLGWILFMISCMVILRYFVTVGILSLVVIIHHLFCLGVSNLSTPSTFLFLRSH